jgi:hypothetical protein
MLPATMVLPILTVPKLETPGQSPNKPVVLPLIVHWAMVKRADMELSMPPVPSLPSLLLIVL